MGGFCSIARAGTGAHDISQNPEHRSRGFLWVSPVRLFSLYKILYPKKQDRILLYVGYHNIPKLP